MRNVAVGGLRESIEARRDLLRDLGAVDQEPDLGVEPQRAMIEIHRAHEHALPVEHENLGVNGELTRAGRLDALAPIAVRGRCRTHLVEFHAVFEQSRAVMKITGMHDRDVGRGE